ncbi:ABC transporter substrate-binding protein [Bordetella hinzii]|jgi:branched-chain amino acid transport system substrate-binding protein|uniref:ABC transporter substrate-binding protein n=1 Tax=Bordetella hinzii TaxID=103855 RepID=UPI0004969374|nr:ABC transporter substrate-binding protein [Bordetella hinzii]AKQ56805.1 hypothetical protein ACR54_03510 [Bordetella hinzii]QDJ33239.1 hypothetical protein CBR68_13440 [Bordetella hinzii]QDJ37836.1 hypothetical protein CBR67_14850 [Bordetella hinzii]SNV69438.1 branched-chain amino acid-binding protein [Bordetella hinzii]VEH25147.1 branched-chain amino acid-binding protein [Bordetella hinzii]
MRFPFAFVVGLSLVAGAAHAEPPVPIRLGEAHAQADTSDFGQGWRMALDEINQAAGVLGRPLEVVAVDVQAGAARPADISLLFDGNPDDALALQTSHQAAAWRLPYLAGRAQTDRLIWQEGNRYTFRLPPSTRMRIAALAPRALALRQKRWALVYTASQRGQEEAATFASMMTAFQSKTEIVSRLAVAPGQVDAGLLRAIDESRPQALLLALDGPDLAAFARLMRAQPQADLLPAVLTHGEDLPGPAPAGWIAATHGDSDSQAAFASAYQARTGRLPTLPALQGYIALQSLAQALRVAQSTDAEKLADALQGLALDTPLGPIQYRKIDHQSTMGLFVGAGEGQESPHYVDGSRLQLPDPVAYRMRDLSKPPRPASTAPAPPTQEAAPAPPAYDVSRFASGGAALPAWPD